MMIRKILSILMITLSLSVLSAETEYYLGLGLAYDANKLASDNLQYFKNYGNGNISMLNAVGLSFNSFFVPYSKFRLGFVLDGNILFPVGYMDSSGNTVGYISFNFDNRLDLFAGLGYCQMFSRKIGGFIQAGMAYSWYRTAENNDPNDRTPVEFTWFGEWSTGAVVGIMTRNKNSYFRVSASFMYTLFHAKEEGFRFFIGAGGGYIF